MANERVNKNSLILQGLNDGFLSQHISLGGKSNKKITWGQSKKKILQRVKQNSSILQG
jgi:hypothetical protein